jgi:Flp pilus assembly protein CpaB
LVLLVGVFLAVIAFVGVLVLSQGTPPTQPGEETEATVVVARENIPLGTVIREEQIETKTVPILGKEADAYTDPSQVVGQTAREDVAIGGQITAGTLSGGIVGRIVDLRTPPGMRLMSIRVDQVTGVGTLVKAGDYVDVLVRFDIEVVQFDEDGNPSVVEGLDKRSTKLLVQGVQVAGILLPTVAATTEGQPETQTGTALVDQQEIVILSLTPAQAEVMKFIEDPNLETFTVSLVLRAPGDFLDENGNPVLPESPCTTLPLPTVLESPAPSPETYRGCEVTDGVVLSTLVEEYGVLVPRLTELGFVSQPPLPTPAPTESPEASPSANP